MSGERFPLSDPTLPVDPEAVTRSLGAALASRHADSPAGNTTLRLADLAAHVVAATQAEGGTMATGPLAGRDLVELAGFAAAAVERVPTKDEQFVRIVPGLTLDHCLISTQGDVEIVGDAVWGDRHLDLAAAAVGVAERFGNAVVGPLIEAYGTEVDLLTLDACQQLNAVAAEVGWPAVGQRDDG